MYTIAICEDIDKDRGILHNSIDKYFKDKGMTYKLFEYWSGEEFLNYAKPYVYDIVIFDVEMGKINGIDTAKKFRELDKTVIIIFVTIQAEMVFSSFSAEPLHYLVKPINYPQFYNVMNRAIEKLDQNKNGYFVATFNNDIYNIPLREILYFESFKRIVIITTFDKGYQFYAKLDDIERELEKKGFIRCHQSYLVNSIFIRKIEKDTVYLVNGKEIRISRTKSKIAREKFMLLIEGRLS